MIGKLLIARTPEEAIKAKADGGIILAGGTEVNRLGSGVNENSFISIRRTPSLRSVNLSNGTVKIGSACTFQELVDNSITPAYLKEALLFMASRTRRNMATIGGNIASCRDDSFLIPTLIAANAELELLNKDCTRSISVWEYVSSRACYTEDLIISINVPAEAAVASKRYSNTAQSHARLTAAMGIIDGEYVPACAIKNVGIYRLDKTAIEDIAIEDDLIYGGAAYRKYLLDVTISMLREKLDDSNKKGGAL